MTVKLSINGIAELDFPTAVPSVSVSQEVATVNINNQLAQDDDVLITSPTDGQVLTYNAASSKWKNAAVSGGSSTGVAGITINGGGSVPTTGSKGYLQIPFNATILSWTMLADVSGSAQITVKKSTYSGFPTTTSIVASAPPNLSSAQKNTSSTLTGWTTAITAGDVLEFNLDSVSTCTRIVLELTLQK